MLVVVLVAAMLGYPSASGVAMTTSAFSKDSHCYNYTVLAGQLDFLTTNSTVSSSLQGASACSHQVTCVGYLLAPLGSNAYCPLEEDAFLSVRQQPINCTGTWDFISALYVKRNVETTTSVSTTMMVTSAATVPAATSTSNPTPCVYYYVFRSQHYCMHLMSLDHSPLNFNDAKAYCTALGGYLMSVEAASDLDGLTVAEHLNIWTSAQLFGAQFFYKTSAYTDIIPWHSFVSDPTNFASGSECSTASFYTGWGWGVTPSHCLGLNHVACMIQA